MKTIILSLLGLFGLAAITAPAPTPTVQEVLAKAKAAQGGSVWDRVATIRSQSTLKTAGLQGSLVTLDDVKHGATVERYDLGVTKGADGFDGKNSWSQDATGASRMKSGAETRQENANTAYLTCRAYWFPERGKAELSCIGEQRDEGRSFHVLKIHPEGGYPFEIWVDAQTGYFDRMVARRNGKTQMTFYTDYRNVENLMLPFSTRITDGDSQQEVRTQSITLNAPVETGAFSIPVQRIQDAGIEGERRSTVVPLEFLADHFFIQVKLNSRGPFRICLDTGGLNMLTPAMAQTLGISGQGKIAGSGVGEKTESFQIAKVAQVQIGEAWMKDQTFYILPALENIFKKMGVPCVGILGFELLQRFVAHIEYIPGRLTLHLPSAWIYAGKGVTVPFVFDDRTPMVEGELDGIPGTFKIDTGSNTTLDVFGFFAAKHNLAAKAKVSFSTSIGYGVGGAVPGIWTRARKLRLGGVSMDAPIVTIASTSQGTYATEQVAGNVGQGFLKRFDLVFDYPRQTITFEKNANHAEPDRWSNMSGIVFNPEAPGEITQILPQSPAQEAGLKVGETILSINGKPFASQTPLAPKLLSEVPAGTKVQLVVRSGNHERTLTLTLRDLL